MKPFHNPYHFIPVTGRVNGKATDAVPYAKLNAPQRCERHDLAHRDGLGGTLRGRVTLESPTFVGGELTREDPAAPARFTPYLRNGLPAIPGNTLRGLVGGIAEALSQSALRRLDDPSYSVRQTANEANGKTELGELRRDGDRWILRSLSSFKVPTREAMRLFNGGDGSGRCYGDPQGKKVFAEPGVGRIEGRLRILDLPRDDNPGGRENDRFVYAHERSHAFPVEPAAVATYVALCEERWKASKDADQRLPYLYHGLPDAQGKEPWRPRDGLTLYYREKGGRVVELSPSQIWRDAIGHGAHHYFGALGKNLLPWGYGDRDALTPAERLFGVVEEQPEAKRGETGRNLASRVRFFDASLPEGTPDGELYHGSEVTLRILSSPKPPSPAMYFHPKGKMGQWLAKKDLKEGRQTIHPNGRKYYLHHPQEQIKSERWKTATDDNPKQKVRVRPLKSGLVFHFEIRFDNLTTAELTLLHTALHPGEEFRHRLGLGKSLGLGRVRLEVDSIELRDAAARYGLDALEAPAIAERWTPDEKTPKWLRDRSLIDSETLEILRTLGDPARLADGAAVHTPLAADQITAGKSEEETFKWFVNNDRAGIQPANRQALSSVPGWSSEKRLPTLLPNRREE
ncbi:TIGR03986 family type III CRISPR-associated RAMP protein [Endothiovibrio diazotrophicus]